MGVFGGVSGRELLLMTVELVAEAGAHVDLLGRFRAELFRHGGHRRIDVEIDLLFIR